MKYYVVVTPFFPSPNNWRGAYVLDQVKAIIHNSEYEVLVFVESSGNDEYEIDGIKVYQYKTHNTPSNVLNGLFNHYNAMSFVRRVKSLGIDLKEIVYVHCHVSMRAVCGLELKKDNQNIKVLLQHHDLDPFNLRSGVIGRYNWLNVQYKARKALKLYNQVDLHICISKACRDSLLAFPNARDGEVYEDYLKVISKAKGVKSVKPKNIYVLYNGVDTNYFNKTSNTLRSLNTNVFRIGCIGNFWDLKGQIILIKAFHMLHKRGYKNIVLSLLGTGETKDTCTKYLENNNLMQFVEWPKEVNHEQLPEYYRTLNLFVLPSFFEGFGCVFTEAAACGVPFMGCLNQGYSEYVMDKENWLIVPHDYEQLARLIERQYLKRQPQKLRYTYDINELIKDYLEYIKKI